MVNSRFFSLSRVAALSFINCTTKEEVVMVLTFSLSSASEWLLSRPPASRDMPC